MNFPRHTTAEGTAAILQEAAHGGRPVMIPGALELRVGRPATQAANVTAEPVTSHAHPVVMGGRERLQYEREGGGAPRERPSDRHELILARLWHYVCHPADLIVWHPLPEER